GYLSDRRNENRRPVCRRFAFLGADLLCFASPKMPGGLDGLARALSVFGFASRRGCGRGESHRYLIGADSGPQALLLPSSSSSRSARHSLVYERASVAAPDVPMDTLG